MTQQDSTEIKKADEHFDEEAGSEELLRSQRQRAVAGTAGGKTVAWMARECPDWGKMPE